MDILLDTSPIVAHIRKKISLYDFVDKSDQIFITIFTLGELQKGIYRADSMSKERARVNAFLHEVAILYPTADTAEHYGKVSGTLEAVGKRLPENDMWIAASAIETDTMLLSADRHFERVDNLKHQHITW